MPDVEAWELESHVGGSAKTYRIYVVSSLTGSPRWCVQWGKIGLTLGGGQWKDNPSGIHAKSDALDQRDAKLNKGYLLVKRAKYTVNTWSHYYLDFGLAKHARITAASVEPDLPDTMKDSLIEMLKQAGRR